jgi:tRNA pseudouridine38-40 synthase
LSAATEERENVPRFKLTIEYTGTRYSGWQIQKNARTVQGEIDRAVRGVTHRKDFELYGAGRTDAGVHAVAQVAHLDVITDLPAASLVRRINDELPADINVLSAVVVPHRFHARHDAVARRYVYQLARRRTAFAKAYVWWVKDDLNLAAMREAARPFVGLRDFKRLAEREAGERRQPGSGRSTTVLVERLEIVEDGDLVLVGIEGSHFLWKMVRRLAGVLVEIGRGRLDVESARRLVEDEGATAAAFTAPPSGLFLERVYYDRDPRGLPFRAVTPLDSLAHVVRPGQRAETP